MILKRDVCSYPFLTSQASLGLWSPRPSLWLHHLASELPPAKCRLPPFRGQRSPRGYHLPARQLEQPWVCPKTGGYLVFMLKKKAVAWFLFKSTGKNPWHHQTWRFLGGTICSNKNPQSPPIGWGLAHAATLILSRQHWSQRLPGGFFPPKEWQKMGDHPRFRMRTTLCNEWWFLLPLCQ